MSDLTQETKQKIFNEVLEDIRKGNLKYMKSQRNQVQYNKRLQSKEFCHSCGVFIDKYCFNKHLETRKHLRRAQMLNH